MVQSGLPPPLSCGGHYSFLGLWLLLISLLRAEVLQISSCLCSLVGKRIVMLLELLLKFSVRWAQVPTSVVAIFSLQGSGGLLLSPTLGSFTSSLDTFCAMHSPLLNLPRAQRSSIVLQPNDWAPPTAGATREIPGTSIVFLFSVDIMDIITSPLWCDILDVLLFYVMFLSYVFLFVLTLIILIHFALFSS